MIGALVANNSPTRRTTTLHFAPTKFCSVTQNTPPSVTAMIHMKATKYECEKCLNPSPLVMPSTAAAPNATTATAAALTNSDCPASARRMLSPKSFGSFAGLPLPLSSLPLSVAIQNASSVRYAESRGFTSAQAGAQGFGDVLDAAGARPLQSAHVHDD